MKRNLLAIVIPALLVAGSATASIEIYNKNGNKVDIFGKVKALNYLTKTGNDDGDHSKVNFGFNGYSVISNNLAGYGSFEYEAKAGKDDNETKYAYAGLDFGAAGQFDYGRNDGVLKALTAYTDVLPEFGGDASDNSLYALSKRGSGVATYRNNNFFGAVDGLSFALQYADKQGYDSSYNSVTGQETLVSNTKTGFYDREAYGLNVQYSNILDTGFTLGAGYATTSKSKSQGFDKRGQTYMVGGNYDANNLYVGALFAYSKDVDYKKVKGYEMVVKYGFDLDVGRITPSLAYIQHKVKEMQGDSYRNEHKYVDVGLTYDFNKNLSAIVDYKINLLKKEDVGNIKSKDTVALGLIYKF